MEKKVSGVKMHRIWAFIVSLVITAAAVVAIVVLAAVSKNSTGPNNAEDEIIEGRTEGTLIEDGNSDTTTNSDTTLSNNNQDTISTDTSPNTVSSSDPQNIAGANSSVPDTGPEDILGLALLCGSVAMFAASCIMVKRDNLAVNQ